MSSGASIPPPPVAPKEDVLGHVVAQFGDRRKSGMSVVTSVLSAHQLISRGMKRGAVVEFVSRRTSLEQADIAKALGISLRTLQRFAEEPSGKLSTAQGSRAWKLAEVLAKATEVFGTQEDAEAWLKSSAMALDGHCPIDLLSTTAGTELVEDLLGRLEYGVYT